MDETACILLINDIHVSKDNISEFFVNWDEALDVCKNLRINEIAIGGDLFMSRASQTLDVLLATRDAFLKAEQQNINITIANGNHDKINQEANRGYCHIFDQHPNVCVVDDYISLVPDPTWNFVLHIIAYFPENGSFKDKLDDLVCNNLDKERCNFLYIHEGISGALKHSSENELPTHIFKAFEKVFVAHYHNRKNIEDTNISYIGSSRQHNFGEDEEKGYTVIYKDGSTKFIANQKNTRFITIDVLASDIGVHFFNQLEEINTDNRYRVKVRVHSSGTEAPGIDKEKILVAGANKIEIVVDDNEMLPMNSSSLFEKFDNQRIKESYEKFCSEKEIEDIGLGLKYLSKIAPLSCGD